MIGFKAPESRVKKEVKVLSFEMLSMNLHAKIV